MLFLWYFRETSSPFRPRFFSLGIRLIGVSSHGVVPKNGTRCYESMRRDALPYMR